ncbi:Crp/Fnr family transcriptional regulator [Allorhizobium sonneratiae]|uniref:Crp/Fnr family transcriptional regulator n=1 Tax=Allorhizobium sonneratiae TaxID=2934936 RepID=UPI0020341E7E|nr:Crp/Fnr family transcriptional regulator [Allorhizobium sonneratiae]
MTETDAQVVRVPQDVLLDILAANHDVCLQILQMMAVRLHLTATHLCELSNLDVRHRLYNALLRLSRMDPANPRVRLICPPLTHTDLADHVGARRETVSREMSRLIQSNIIEKTSRAITIRQPYELTRLMAQVFKT